MARARTRKPAKAPVLRLAPKPEPNVSAALQASLEPILESLRTSEPRQVALCWVDAEGYMHTYFDVPELGPKESRGTLLGAVQHLLYRLNKAIDTD